jgi:hypothetical protein
MAVDRPSGKSVKLMRIAPLARARNRERAHANFVRRFNPIWVVQPAREK